MHTGARSGGPLKPWFSAAEFFVALGGLVEDLQKADKRSEAEASQVYRGQLRYRQQRTYKAEALHWYPPNGYQLP